ncbi:MAG: orotate phosphoribosyltransferase [Spirochaetales bacterium]|nr:orotate phosphoribosyltransferase [Spirochaetales bacterium]
MKTIEEITSYYGPQLAKGAFELGAIRLSPNDPFTWASGYRMPIYNDNRQFLAKSNYRALICDAFSDMLTSLGFDPANIAGTATAGIPHATTLADRLHKPLSYVRSSSKDHGLGHQIEGLGKDGSYHGEKVVLIEDLISTGKSSLAAVEAIQKANGDVPYCLAIFTYGLSAAEEAFNKVEPSCKAFTILSYDVMIKTAVEVGYVSDKEADELREWRKDPFGWGNARGFMKVER